MFSQVQGSSGSHIWALCPCTWLSSCKWLLSVTVMPMTMSVHVREIFGTGYLAFPFQRAKQMLSISIQQWTLQSHGKLKAVVWVVWLHSPLCGWSITCSLSSCTRWGRAPLWAEKPWSSGRQDFLGTGARKWWDTFSCVQVLSLSPCYIRRNAWENTLEK